MDTINIQFTLFSAFYSPVIATFAGGFLRDEGLQTNWTVAEPGVSALAALENGTAHVVQSALSQGFTTLGNGQVPAVKHFAQVNEMDGFFLSARAADTDFNWQKLEGSSVVLFSGGQPLVMFKYACQKAGVDFDKINVLNVGGAADMDKAFREGRGDYVQQQGPFPQQLEADKVGFIVAQVGDQIGPCGFSSLAANPAWLETDMGKAFVRAYKKTRIWMNETSATEIAKTQQEYFPNINIHVLENCIATYQKLGNWTPHIEITEAAYAATLDIYENAGGLQQRYEYNQVCCKPPIV